MAFIQLENKLGKKRGDSSDKVSFTFRKIKKIKEENRFRLIIQIGHKKAKQIGIKLGDKIKFLYCEENPRVWLIKKSKNRSNDGSTYTVGSNPNTKFCLIVQITWLIFEPDESEFSLKEVKTDLYERGIRIFSNLLA